MKCSKILVGLAFVLPFVFGFFGFGAEAKAAISGAPSNFFPDTDPSGRNSYEIVQLSPDTGSVWLKAQTALADVFVPASLSGSNVSITVLGGCDNSPAGMDVNGWYAQTSFVIPGVTPNLSSDANCTGGNVQMNFVAGNGTPATFISNNVRYMRYTFVASAFGADNSGVRYANFFQLQSNTAGVLLGVARDAISCDIASYPASCPTAFFGTSWVYSSFIGTNNPFSERIVLDTQTNCSTRGRITLYDLDANNISLNQVNLRVTFYQNGVALVSLSRNQLIALSQPPPGLLGSNENQYTFFPDILSQEYQFQPGSSYELRIEGVDDGNAIQMMAAFNENCLWATADCVNRQVDFTYYDNNNYTAQPIIYYTIDGGPLQTVVGTTLDMSGYAQNVPHTVTYYTYGVNGNGTEGPPTDKAPNPTGSMTYGASAGSGCQPATFSFTPGATSVTVDNADSPTTVSAFSVFFNSNNIVADPDNTPAKRNLTAEVYVLRASGAVDVKATIASPNNGTSLASENFNYAGSSIDLSSGPGGIPQAGDSVCVRSIISPAEGTADASGNVLSVAVASRTSAGACSQVLASPIVKFFANDVAPGGGFSDSSSANLGCTYTSSGMILASADNLRFGGDYRGSSVQFAAKALGSASGFYSASDRSAAPVKPKGLTQANNTAAEYGGDFGGSGVCVKDFYSDLQDESVMSPPGALNPSIDPSTWIGGRQYQTFGNTTISGAGAFTMALGQKNTLFVSGNLYIRRNMQYNTAYGGVMSNIPALMVVVRGNIYIDPSVTRLDGVYVAQQTNSSNGHIVTCWDAPSWGWDANPSSDALPAGLHSACLPQLTVNGALLAQRTRFLRTNGSLSKSIANENPYPGGAGVANVAEVIRYTPEVFIASPIIPSILRFNAGTYQASASLPPLF